MKPRTDPAASRLPTVLLLLALVLVLVSLGFQITIGPTGGTVILDLAVFLSATLGYATVGRLVASRQPANPIGWLFLVSGLAFAIAGLTDAYAVRGLRTAPGSLPLVPLAVWIQQWIYVPAMASIPLAILLFPTGRLPSRWWRPAAWSVVGGAAVAVIGLTIKPGPAGGAVMLENPTGISGLGAFGGALQTIGGVMVVVGAIASVVAVVVRFRHARGQERQQLRWLAYVSGIAIGIFGLSWLAEPLLGERGVGVSNVLWIAFFVVLTLGIPAATGIAILRYRLYSLDFVIRKTVVFGLLAGFVTAAYFVVVIGIPGVLFGADRSGADLLPFAAAAVLAIAFQPVRRWANRLANRLVYGSRATPYEVLSEFAGRAAGTYATDEVLPRMAELVSRGTGASRSAVWLLVGGDLRREAAHPADDSWPVSMPAEGGDLPSIPGTDACIPVRHRGELLGALTVGMPASEPLTPAHEALLNDVASQAGLVLRNVRLIEDLRESRQRIVAAQDEERRRLERNIHDGAQQQLVALAVKLRLAETLVDRDGEKAKELIAQVKGETQDALDNLRDLARGIYPPLLADKGLGAALEAQARKAAVPVEVHPDGVGRYSQEVEAGAYFCVLEALQNVAKYAEATRVDVALRADDGHLVFEVRDDGRGFDTVTTPTGSGLTNMRDRLEALGGSVEIASRPGHGTTVRGRIPASHVAATATRP